MPPPPPSTFPSTPIAQLLGSNGPIHAVTYSSPPSPYILTGSSDRLIRLYNPSPPTTHTSPPSSHNTITTPTPPSTPPPGKLITTFPPLHSHPILSLSISTSNSTFLSSGGDRTLFLWDVATTQSTRRFHGHVGRINAVCFAGASDSLALSGGIDGTVRIWDLRSASGKAVQVLAEARDAVTSVVAPRDGWEVVSGSVDGRVRGYDVRMGRCVVDVVGASVTSLDLDDGDKGETVLVGGLDSKVRMMDRKSGGCLRVFEAEGWRNEGVRVQSCFGGGGRWVVAGDEFPADEEGGEGRVWAWDVMTGKVVARLGVPWGEGGRRMGVGRDGREKGRRNVVSCVAWKDGGRGDQFCVGGTSGVVTVFGKGGGV